MNTNDENPTHSGGLNRVTKEKSSIEQRYLDSWVELPTGVINRMNGADGDPDCVPVNIASDLLKIARNNKTVDLMREHPYLLPNGISSLTLTDEQSIDEQFMTASVKASVLTSQMIEQGSPVLCVSKTTFDNARELAEKHEAAQFTFDNRENILNGPFLSRKADDEFDAVCSRLRMPRRTRTTIRKKREAAMNNANS